MRRQPRLFAITEHLRARRSGTTAEAIAQHFGVTVRTIYRDLEALREAQLPLSADRGPGGGYALDRAYSLPPVSFTAREAALLVTLGRFARQSRLLPFAGTLERALDKVEGALSSSAQRELLELMQGLQFVGVPALPVPESVRKAVETAWFEQVPLRLRYRAADDLVTTRQVRVDSVVMERSQTLLNCHDLDKNQARQFRLDRIESASLLRSTK